MTDRRDFLSLCLRAVAASFTPALPVSANDRGHDANRSARFGRALRHDPRLLGWMTPRTDQLHCPALTIEGDLPLDLRGTFRRNGPAGHDRHGLRYRHWFDGDGMIQEFRFTGNGVTHRGRMIATPKLTREDAAGRRLTPTFATPVPDGEAVRRPDDMNTANISVLDHHGELLALWEGGSPSLLHRDTLAWEAFKSWGDALAGAPFTAHPKVESDGTVWAFGYSLGGPNRRPMLVLYHIAADGRLVKSAVVEVNPLGMVHDFVVTARHLVFVIPPLVYEPEHGGTFLDAHHWRPELGTRVLVVSKDDFGARHRAELPAGFGFHHGNGWEEADGTIRFDHCVAGGPEVLDVLRRVMDGELRRMATGTRYARFTLYPDGRTAVDSEERSDTAEFPVVAPGVVGRRNRFVYTLGAGGEKDGWAFGALVKRDLERERTEHFDFGPGVIPEEHIFVPAVQGRAEDDGWLVGTVLAYARSVTGVTVFNARNIPAGPLATAWLPYPLPLGLHGQFSCP